MENLSLSGADFNDHMFNSQIEQQYMHSSPHFKHQHLMSNLFKRNMDDRSAKDDSLNYHKDIEVKPFSQMSQRHDLSKENPSYADDIDHNDVSMTDSEHIYSDSTKSRNQLCNENQSLNEKKLMDESQYFRLSKDI